ncbi:MAG: 1-(5-phosphoribosyl)-5-[(5-phosphoribosylamino)methylideneamino]imidazole-4-carboxamide isomerase [Clostridiaceae bacterium]|nr:1-(5-phosphoribosyl)-5-[(5-phosphoribosylamino)methylideneamino]imidazole-4-carboxamide isomerase [Clostridiaceae bacterium]
MKILPAIDLKGGQCVRLQKGDYGTAQKVAEDAVETAKGFLAAGARLIHMVDLDGAKSGSRANYDVVRRVIDCTSAAVELGGGIRSMEDLRHVLSLGISRAVIGSAAVRNPAFVREACAVFGDKVAVGIDARGGTVRTEGWLHDSGEEYLAFARRMVGYGVQTIIFTDIEKDGMLGGPNFEQLSALRDAVSCTIVASGGVSTLEDVQRLKALGIDEAIAGKAVYTGALDLAAAIREAE